MRGHERLVRVAFTMDCPLTDWGEDVHPLRTLQDSMSWSTVDGERKFWTYWRDIGSPPGMLAMVGWGAEDSSTNNVAVDVAVDDDDGLEGGKG